LVFILELLVYSLHASSLFAKYFPTIAIAEIKHVLKTTGESYKNENEWH
jgi:hypothetical protein